MNLPQELIEQLPKTDGGVPILISMPGHLGPGIEVQLTYDPTQDDPITRRGHCLGRVLACYRANPAGALAGCVDLIEVCASDQGGKGCCPRACIDAFRAAVASGLNEDDAVDESFVKGDCIAGFAQYRRDAGGGP